MEIDKNTLNKEEVQKKAEGLADKIGGGLEKLGHKIADAGAETLGQKIHDIGDSLETKHKNPEHPHNV